MDYFNSLCSNVLPHSLNHKTAKRSVIAEVITDRFII